MPWPVGENLKKAMRALDALGPCEAVVIQRATDPERSGHASTYLKRAVQMGWATVTGVGRLSIYTAVPGWEKGKAMKRQEPTYPKVPDRIPARHALQAVWQ